MTNISVSGTKRPQLNFVVVCGLQPDTDNRHLQIGHTVHIFKLLEKTGIE